MSRGAYDGYEAAQGWSAGSFGACPADLAAYFQAELAALGVAPRPPLQVLDIGFGNGSFLGWCRSNGIPCHGVELNARLVQRADRHGFPAATDIASLQAQTTGTHYGLVTAFDVLEHIERAALVDFLRQLRPICSQDTLLLFRFPNGDNPFALPLQNGDVTHVTAIGQSMLRQIAAMAGFDVVALRSPALPTASASALRRVAIMVGVPLRWGLGQLLRHLFMGGADVRFSSNLVAVLRCRPAPH